MVLPPSEGQNELSHADDRRDDAERRVGIVLEVELERSPWTQALDFDAATEEAAAMTAEAAEEAAAEGSDETL